ncbi:hypothetical protein B0H13DRAFT_1862351 [Mycena leptocephala]|nr:hypothetical protein B0H13DRAFT_1862351 [Mycena leptocephala]
MPDTSTHSSTPDQELAVLVSKVAALSKLALDMTRHCLDVSDNLPASSKLKWTPKLQRRSRTWLFVATGATFYRSDAPTPDEMDAMFPPGRNDDLAHVIRVGREPGLYTSKFEANDQVIGVPGHARKKKDNRQEALRYYCSQHGANNVYRVSETALSAAPAAPAPSSSAVNCTR